MCVYMYVYMYEYVCSSALLRRLKCAALTPSRGTRTGHQIALFNSLGLYWTEPDSGDLQCKPGVSCR